MGDHITSFYPCPKGCGGEVEEYDASSSLMFSASCNKCNWKDPREYFERSATEIVLCTEEEARENGSLVNCKKCKREIMKSCVKGNGCYDCKGGKDMPE